jgi:formylglycine-generating enzyme required for sulfatase activity
MKTGKWAFTCIAAIIVCGFFFSGCNDSGNDASVTGVTLSGDAEFSIAVGESSALSYTVLPANATNKNVRWSSSNTGVAIASEGFVYGIGVGEATITVTTRDGGKTAACTVTVTPNVPVTGVKMDKPSILLAVGASELLTPVFSPGNASNRRVTWTSINTNVATVNNGTVTGVGRGSVTIVATSEDGGFEAFCAVTVATNAEVPGMVWIKPGTFMMGSPMDELDSWESEELHQVTLTEGFYMGKYPVTQKQYKETMGVNDSIFPDPSSDYYIGNDDWEDYPVENVNWYEAIKYCNVRSMDEGFSPAYTMYKADAPNADDEGTYDWVDIPDNWSTDPEDWGYIPYSDDDNLTRWDNVRVVAGSTGYRLPTEAQWEYACRAGTTTPFNTGDNIAWPVLDGNDRVVGGQANYVGWDPYNGEFDFSNVYLGQTIPVGLFPPNEWGLCDMHGNVAEWCWDWLGSYRDVMTNTDPQGPALGGYRVFRGGSWNSGGKYLRSAFRDGYEPYVYEITVGFRVVRPYSAGN